MGRKQDKRELNRVGQSGAYRPPQTDRDKWSVDYSLHGDGKHKQFHTNCMLASGYRHKCDKINDHVDERTFATVKHWSVNNLK